MLSSSFTAESSGYQVYTAMRTGWRAETRIFEVVSQWTPSRPVHGKIFPNLDFGLNSRHLLIATNPVSTFWHGLCSRLRPCTKNCSSKGKWNANCMSLRFCKAECYRLKRNCRLLCVALLWARNSFAKIRPSSRKVHTHLLSASQNLTSLCVHTVSVAFKEGE